MVVKRGVVVPDSARQAASHHCSDASFAFREFIKQTVIVPSWHNNCLFDDHADAAEVCRNLGRNPGDRGLGIAVILARYCTSVA